MTKAVWGPGIEGRGVTRAGRMGVDFGAQVKRLALTHIERGVRKNERARVEALRYDTGIAVLLPKGGERIAV